MVLPQKFRDTVMSIFYSPRVWIELKADVESLCCTAVVSQLFKLFEYFNNQHTFSQHLDLLTKYSLSKIIKFRYLIQQILN